MKNFIVYLSNRPRLSLIYGLSGVLVLLLLLLLVNEKNWRPLKQRSPWEVTSNFSPALANDAVDRDLETAWSSYAPTSFGMYVQLNINTPTVLNGIVVHSVEDASGQPDEWLIKTSLDGQSWHTATRLRQMTHRSLRAFIFAPVTAQYLQIVLTAGSPTDAKWVINELDLLTPIVPWQVERATVIYWLIGGGWAMLCVVVCVPARGASWKQVLCAIAMILILLLGWGGRIHDLRSYEPSAAELKTFFMLDFGKYTHTEWLKGYVQHVRTGASWLTFLFHRWTYQLLADDLLPLRIVPAIFAMGTVFLFFLLRKILLFSENATGLRSSAGDFQETWLTAILFSVSGFSIFLCRKGDSVALLVFFLFGYLGMAYHFLYRAKTSRWLPALLLAHFVGFFIHPALRYAPIGIILFEGISLLFQAPKIREKKRAWQTHGWRFIGYILSALPLYGYEALLNKAHWLRQASWPDAAFIREFAGEGVRALRFSGFTGVWGWILAGIALLGIVRVIVSKQHGEWFFYSQCLLFSLCAAVFASPEEQMAWPLPLLVVALSAFVKGLLRSVKFILRDGKINFALQGVLFLAVITYFAGFSINSLFVGNAAYPYNPALYEAYAQEKQIVTLMEHIAADPNECKSIGIFERSLTHLYASMYRVDLYSIQLFELEEFAETGRFWTYLLIPHILDDADRDQLAPILSAYYTKIGQSLHLSFYALQNAFQAQPQIYFSDNLIFMTGRRIQDAHSSQRKVLAANRIDPPGFLAVTPAYRACQRGRYLARFTVRTQGNPDDMVAALEVIANRYDSLARLELRGSDFDASDRYRTIDLPFTLDLRDNPAFPVKRLQLFVHFTGIADVRVESIALIPETANENRELPF